MNILLCNTTDSGGGAAKAAYRLHKGIQKNSVVSRFLTMHKKKDDSTVLNVFDYHERKSSLKRLFDFVAYKIRNKFRKNKWDEYPKREKNVSFSDVTFSHIGKSLEIIPFDILHLHWVDNEFMNYKELQDIDKPIVWTLHDCFPFTGICRYYECENQYYKTECQNCPILKSDKKFDLSTEMMRLKKERYKKLDLHIVCPSHWLAERAGESSLLGNRPIHVIPNGIDTDLYNPIEKKTARSLLGSKPDKKTILFGAISATADKRKGYRYLEHAISLLEKTYSADEIEIIVFGSYGDDKNEENYFNTTFLGYISDERLLAIAYSAADVMVVPSTHENLPCTIMESLSCGTPVTAFNIGGNGDMIDHQKNGYLAEPYKSEDLAEGIHWCLENNTDNNLGRRGRQKVIANYGYRDIAKTHIELYKSLISV